MSVKVTYDRTDATFINELKYVSYDAAKAAGAWHRTAAQNMITKTSKNSRKNIIDFFSGLPLSHPYWVKVAPQYFTAVEIDILQKGNKKQIRATVDNANWRLQNEQEAKYGKKGKRNFGVTKINIPAPPGKGFGYATGTLHNAVTWKAGIWPETGGAGFYFGLPERLTHIEGKMATQNVLATHEVGRKGYDRRPILHPALEAGIKRNINFKELAKAYKARIGRSR